MIHMQHWHEHLDPITQQVSTAFGGLTAAQLNWKPDAATWSVAQNIDHLIVINESYFPIIDALEQGTYRAAFLSKLGFFVSFCEKTVLKSVQPDRVRKMKTFPIWEPRTSDLPADILETFRVHQASLKDMMQRASRWVAEETVISSPANRNIVYRLGTAFEVIVTHERRHLAQAEEVMAQMRRAKA